MFIRRPSASMRMSESALLGSNSSGQTQTVVLSGVEAIQHGRRIIVGKIAVKDLALLYERRVVRVDEFSAANPDGYQRSLMKTRSRRFGRFIADINNGISPTSLLLYVRDQTIFPEDSGNGTYLLPTELPNSREALMYIADGQHRTDGFAEAIREGWLTPRDEFDVPVTILFWDPAISPQNPRLEEAGQFYTINQEQRRMRTDLAHQYIFRQRQIQGGPIGDNTPLRRMKKKEYIPYEVYIARRLQNDTDSPFRGLISIPNTSTGFVSEGTFTDSLVPVMSHAVTAGLTVGQTILLLKSYWKAIFALCPDSVAQPEESMLLKTVGVYTLHIVLPTLLIRRPNLGNQPQAQQVQQVLETIGNCFTNEFWGASTGEAAGFGGGYKAFRELADRILEEL